MKVSKNARFGAALLAGLAAFAWVEVQLVTKGQQIDALSTALTQEQHAAREDGRTPVAPPPASIIRSPGVVETPRPASTVDVDAIVAQVLARIPTPQDGAPGRPGRPPSADEVARALVAYCTAHGCPPMEQVTAAVAASLAAHPPPPGPPGPSGSPGPSGAPCDPNLNPDCRGPQGPQGPPGPTPTAAELDAAVRRVIAEDNVLVCPGTIQDRPAPPPAIGETWRVCVEPAPTPTGGQ